MTDLSRRKMLVGAAASAAALGVATTAKAASFGNPDRPPEGRVNGKSPRAWTTPAPRIRRSRTSSRHSRTLRRPTSTACRLFWASFNNAHKRYQNGGWAREVTQEDFAISKDFAGVNMRLAQNGIRELHWHQQAEWAIVMDGLCRITVLDEHGRAQVADVKSGDLWYFPPGLPHSLQGLGPTGAEFLLAFDNGNASEFNTLLLTRLDGAHAAGRARQELRRAGRVFKNIPLDNLWIFQGEDPGPLAAAQRASCEAAGRARAPVHLLAWRHGADARRPRAAPCKSPTA